MGLPAMVARAFPGKREEANRAGITPRIRVGTIDISMAHTRVANIPRVLARVRVLRDWGLAYWHISVCVGGLWCTHQLAQQRRRTLMDVAPAAIEAVVASTTAFRLSHLKLP